MQESFYCSRGPQWCSGGVHDGWDSGCWLQVTEQECHALVARRQTVTLMVAVVLWDVKPITPSTGLVLEADVCPPCGFGFC